MTAPKSAAQRLEEAQAPKGLHAKLAEVMAAITHIEKSGRNEVQRYDYTRQADVAHAVRTELAQRKVTCIPTSIEVVESRDYESKSGGRQHFLLIRIDWTFTDSESGETFVATSLGAGTDSGDKAPYKAMTGASKYAELLTFLIPTGDDPEKDQPEGSERATPVRDGAETLEFLGNLTKSGTIVPGGASAYKLEWRETPDGHAIGFRLKMPDKDVPQVLVSGAIGEALYLAYPDGASLNGLHVTVKGRLHGVKAPGRSTYFRLIVGDGASDYIETPDVRIPALEPTEATETPAEPVEAPSVPLFELDAEERALVAGGLE